LFDLHQNMPGLAQVTNASAIPGLLAKPPLAT
jgi:hypothetical protein